MLKKTRHADFTISADSTHDAEPADTNDSTETTAATSVAEVPQKPETAPTPEPETSPDTEAALDPEEALDAEAAPEVAAHGEDRSAEPVITGHWNVDPSHTRIGFSARHAMISRIRGAFNEVSGWADIAEDIGASSATVIMQAGSVDTRSVGRDQHLCSEDFFNIEEFPEIRFVSSAIDEVDENSYVVTGDLTIKEVTKSVSVPLELLGIDADPFGNLRAGLEGSRRIDRRAWGMEWNTPLDSGGVLVGEKITLEFEMSLIKGTKAPAAPEADSGAESAEDAPED